MNNIDKPVSLNLNVRGLGKSATLAINEESIRLQSKGMKIYRFGLGQSPFPVPDEVVEALKKNAHQKDYLPVQGLPSLLSSVSQFHSVKDHVHFAADNILVGPGSKELMFLLQLVFYGEILIPSPCWVSYIPQANIIGRKIRLIHTTAEENWLLTPEHLERHCLKDNDQHRPRLLIINYPSNPSGTTYSEEELKKLADIARFYEIIILSDEIYGHIHHDGSHTSIGRFYPEGTILSSGLSKWCGAGGWRIGTFAFPDDLIWLKDAMEAVASETYTSVSAPIQYASVKAFTGSDNIDKYLEHSRKILKALGKKVTAIMKKGGVRVNDPRGGFYIFPDFGEFAGELREKWNINGSRDLCDRLLKDTGVAILPGVDFGRKEEELTSRLAYVNFDGAAALKNIAKLPEGYEPDDDFLRENCPRTLEGVKKIIRWLEGLR